MTTLDLDRNHLVNIQALKLARDFMRKQAIVPGSDPGMVQGDPSMAGAPPGGAPPGAPMGAPMDPAMAGGAPPMDPAMAGGPPPGGPPMDPAMGGGAPPPGGIPPEIQAIIQQEVQKILAQQGGMASGGGAPGGVNDAGQIKPKIDINVEIMQIKNMLAKIIDSLGIPMPAQSMVATPEKLTAMAQGQDVAGQQVSGGGAIPPIQPMKAASDDLLATQNRAAALRHLLRGAS